MKKIGDILRETRERQGLSIDDVAIRTKIHRYKLVAIEEGDRHALPAQVFAVGLIKSYARELKVDLKLIDDLCREAYADEPPPSFVAPIPTSQTVRVADAPEERQSIGLFQVPKILMVLVSLLFIAALVMTILFVSKKMSAYSTEELQSESFVDVPPEEVDKPASLTGAAQIEPVETPVPVNQIKVETSPQPASVTSTKKDEVKVPTPQEPSVQPEVEPVAVKEVVSKSKSQTLTPVVVSADQKLMVKALEPVKIEIVWSDGYNQGLMLKRNESKTLVFSSPILMRIDNGGAVDITFNDQKRGVPGTLNKAIELRFP